MIQQFANIKKNSYYNINKVIFLMYVSLMSIIVADLNMYNISFTQL